MKEDESINIVVDGITFLSTGGYEQGINKWVCHKLKESDDKEVFDYAAKKMAKLISKDPNSIIIPMPNRHGYADKTMKLAKVISCHTAIPIADVLRGNDREPNYQAKHNGHPLTEQQMGFHMITNLPKGSIPYIIDNVVDTGTSAKAAYHAIGYGIIVTYAMSDKMISEKLGQNSGLRR